MLASSPGRPHFAVIALKNGDLWSAQPQKNDSWWWELLPYHGWLRNPNHQLIDGEHPSIYRISTILLVVQDFFHWPGGRSSQERVDCLQMYQDACESAGCCWGPVERPSGANPPWCFYKDRNSALSHFGQNLWLSLVGFVWFFGGNPTFQWLTVLFPVNHGQWGDTTFSDKPSFWIVTSNCYTYVNLCVCIWRL